MEYEDMLPFVGCDNREFTSLMNLRGAVQTELEILRNQVRALRSPLGKPPPSQEVSGHADDLDARLRSLQMENEMLRHQTFSGVLNRRNSFNETPQSMSRLKIHNFIKSRVYAEIKALQAYSRDLSRTLAATKRDHEERCILDWLSYSQTLNDQDERYSELLDDYRNMDAKYQKLLSDYKDIQDKNDAVNKAVDGVTSQAIGNHAILLQKYRELQNEHYDLNMKHTRMDMDFNSERGSLLEEITDLENRLLIYTKEYFQIKEKCTCQKFNWARTHVIMRFT